MIYSSTLMLVGFGIFSRVTETKPIHFPKYVTHYDVFQWISSKWLERTNFNSWHHAECSRKVVIIWGVFIRWTTNSRRM